MRNLVSLGTLLIAVAVVGCAGEEAQDACDDPSTVTTCEDDVTASATEFPRELLHSEDDTPVPSWEQLVRVGRSTAIRRILGHADDERGARARFESFSPSYRRGFV